MRRINLYYLFLVLLFSIVSVGCNNSKKDTIKISVADVLNTENALITIATEKGFWKEEGIEFERKSFSSGKDALQAMIGKQTDFAVSAETPLIWAKLNSDPLKILATLNRTVVKALARKDAKIFLPSDLKGKKIGSFYGTSSDFWMDEFLSANGLAREDIQLINLKPPAMVAAISRSSPDIDAFFAWEPHIVNAISAIGENNATVFTSLGQYTEYFNLSARSDYIENHPDEIERVLRVLIRAEKYLKENISDGQAIMSKFLSIDQSIIKTLWPENSYKVELPQALYDDLGREINWALKSPIASKDAIRFSQYDIIYLNSLQKLDSARVEIKTIKK